MIGDVFYFKDGYKIPADGVVVESNDVKCIEADLTGEPDAFDKVVLNAQNYTDQ